MKLAEYSIKRPVTTLMALACFVITGIIAARMLPLEFMPEASFPSISINIPYPNSTPEEIERQIVRPAEEVLATVSGVRKMSSYSGENNANINLEFKWGVNTDIKAIEAREKLEGIRDQMPADLERIQVFQNSTADMAVLNLRISSHRDLSNAYDMLDRRLKRRLERLPGVSRVTLYGVEKKEVRIQLDANRIAAHKVDLNRLSGVLRGANFLAAAGKITDSGRRFSVRPEGALKTPEEIRGLIVGDNNLRLGDIAHVAWEFPILTYGRHLNLRFAVGLDVYKNTGANIVEVGNRVKQEINEISKDPMMKGISIYFMEDIAAGVVDSLLELVKSGVLGGLLAIVVLFFFLRHFGSSLIVALCVPMSLLITLCVMYFAGISINILSLLGLLLAVGMLVDNSVVVTENIARHRRESNGGIKGVLQAVNEVKLAITAGTLTTVIVFLPNILVESNQIAFYMKHISVAFCVALASSLLLAQSVVPMLASRLKPTAPKATVVDRLAKRYHITLAWLLDHRKTSIALIFGIMFSIVIPAMLVKSEMFPNQNDRRLDLQYNINDNYTLERVERVVTQVEQYLIANRDRFEIESVYSYYQGDAASTTILLRKGDQANRPQEEIREEILKGLPLIALGTPSFDFSSSSGGQGLTIQLNGPSTTQLTELARLTALRLSRIEGLKSVRSGATTGKKEVAVVVDRNKARRAGFTPQHIAGAISVAMRGMNLRPLQGKEGETQVRVEFQREDRQNMEQLSNLVLFDAENKPVKLAALADFQMHQGPQDIRRINRITTIGVSMDLEKITIGEAQERIQAALADFDFPPGYYWDYGSTFDFEQETMQNMMINTLLALALIYFVMAALFESLLFPAGIWLSIIFGIVGVWWFFLITGTTFSFMSWIGVLVLIGVVVNNGIVLIDYVHQLRKAGMPRREALLQAGLHRIRPILMTAGATIFSLIPLCLVTTQIGGDGPPYYPMARAIVGGLSFSTLVTLLILPTIYILMDDLRGWSSRVFRQAKKG